MPKKKVDTKPEALPTPSTTTPSPELLARCVSRERAMTGVIQSVRYSPSRGVALLVVLDECGDVSHAHIRRGPLFHAILAGQLRAGDVVEFPTNEIGTMPMVAVVGDGRPS